jgi:hypothetical protein
MPYEPQPPAQLAAALRFVYTLLAPGQDANSILRQNPERRQQAHRAVWQALQDIKAASGQYGPAGPAQDYDRDIKPDWNTPNPCEAADTLQQVWDQLVQFDFLLPGSWLPPKGPTRTNWLGQAVPIPVDFPLQEWAGEVARARVLMDIKSAATMLRAQAQHKQD